MTLSSSMKRPSQPLSYTLLLCVAFITGFICSIVYAAEQTHGDGDDGDSFPPLAPLPHSAPSLGSDSIWDALLNDELSFFGMHCVKDDDAGTAAEEAVPNQYKDKESDNAFRLVKLEGIEGELGLSQFASWIRESMDAKTTHDALKNLEIILDALDTTRTAETADYEVLQTLKNEVITPQAFRMSLNNIDKEAFIADLKASPSRKSAPSPSPSPSPDELNGSEKASQTASFIQHPFASSFEDAVKSVESHRGFLSSTLSPSPSPSISPEYLQQLPVFGDESTFPSSSPPLSFPYWHQNHGFAEHR